MWITLLEHYFRRKPESNMEKWKIADLANLKCKDRNQYNSCLICQCCWLLCTSYVDTIAGLSKDLKCGTLPGLFFLHSTRRAVMLEKNTSLQTKHYCMYKCAFS